MPKLAAAAVCAYGRLLRVGELMQGVDHGVIRFAVNLWDCGFFEALDEIIDRGCCHSGGGGGHKIES